MHGLRNTPISTKSIWTLLNTPLRLRRRWLFRSRIDPETDGRRIAKWLLVFMCISLPALLSVQFVMAIVRQHPKCAIWDAKHQIGVDDNGKMCRQRRSKT